MSMFLPFVSAGVLFGTKYSRVDQVKFMEDSLEKIRRYMVPFDGAFTL